MKNTEKEREEMVFHGKIPAEILEEMEPQVGKRFIPSIRIWYMESECKDITELSWKACVYLSKEDEELIREVYGIMKSIIRLTRDDLEDALREKEEILQNLEVSIRNAVVQSGKDGKGREEVRNFIQNVFMLQE